MQTQVPRAMQATLAVFLGAVALSMATGGTVSDIGFFIYAAAFVLLVLLAAAWLVARLRPAGR